MIALEQLAAFVDRDLDDAARDALELELEHDEKSLRFVLDQREMDRALGAILGKQDGRDRLTASILAAIAGTSAEALEAHVVADTSGVRHRQAKPEPATERAELTPAAGLCSWLRSRFGAWQTLTRPGLAVALGLVMTAWLVWTWIGHAPLQPEVGRITTILGAPTIRLAGQRSPAAINSATIVRLGDHLETDDADQAEIRFTDGTTLRLHFNTAVEISSLKSPIPKTRPPQIVLLRGQVWTKVQKGTNGPAAPYAIRTAVATAVARGTEFGVKLSHPTLPAGTNLVAVLTVKEGIVDFSNTLGSVRATGMTESTARADAPPTEPKRLPLIQSVRLGSGIPQTLIVSSALTPSDAGGRLAGGGGFAGVQVQPASGAGVAPDAGPTNQIRVVQVQPGSPAARAGLTPGDVLLAMHGRPVTNTQQLVQAVRLLPNASIRLGVRRGGEEKLITLQVGSRANELPGPDLSGTAAAQLTALMQKWLGTDAATEQNRLAEARQVSRSSVVRAAACNNLGVLYELEDSYGPAIRAYGQAAYLDARVPLYHFNLGLALRKIGSLERAAEELARASELAPESISARQWHAEVLSLLGSLDAALNVTEKALAAAPQHHGLWELKARILEQQGALSEATQAAHKAVATEPGCPTARGYLGGALAREGRLVEAEESYRKAVVLAPLEAFHHMNLGIVLNDLGQAQAAEQSLRRAVELRPNLMLGWFNLGKVLGDHRQWDQARAALNKAAELDPEDVGVVHELGRLAWKQGRLDEAEDYLQRALQGSPNQADVFLDLGGIRQTRGRFSDAEQMFLKAAELEPKSPEVYERIAGLYRDGFRRLDKAEELYRKAIDLGPKRARPYSELSHVMMMRRNPAEAERLLRQACALEPSNGEMHNNLGEVLRLQDQLDEAVLSYRKALELNPGNPNAYNNLGIIYAARGDFAEAEKMFRALIERAKTDARINPLNFFINLAMACEKQGKVADAESFYRQALALAPNDPANWNSLAWFLGDHRLNLDEALTLARRAVQAEPNDPNCVDTLGWVLFQRGELEEAERSFNKALELADSDPSAAAIRGHLEALQKKKQNPQ